MISNATGLPCGQVRITEPPGFLTNSRSQIHFICSTPYLLPPFIAALHADWKRRDSKNSAYAESIDVVVSESFERSVENSSRASAESSCSGIAVTETTVRLPSSDALNSNQSERTSSE